MIVFVSLSWLKVTPTSLPTKTGASSEEKQKPQNRSVCVYYCRNETVLSSVIQKGVIGWVVSVQEISQHFCPVWIRVPNFCLSLHCHSPPLQKVQNNLCPPSTPLPLWPSPRQVGGRFTSRRSMHQYPEPPKNYLCSEKRVKIYP